MKSKYKAGDHKATCMRCGKWYRQSELKMEWTGLAVCSQCYEPRHEQEFIRARKDRITPGGPVTGISTPRDCDPVLCTTRTSVAGEAIAGCAIAGYSEPELPSGTFDGGL